MSAQSIAQLRACATEHMASITLQAHGSSTLLSITCCRCCMGVQVQAQAQRRQRKLSTLDEDGEDGLFSRLSMAVRSLADRRRSAAYYDENGSMASGSVIGADAGLGGGQLRLQKRECMDGRARVWDNQVQQFLLTSGGLRKVTTCSCCRAAWCSVLRCKALEPELSPVVNHHSL